jgi:uncharacterized protein YraI
MSTEFRRSAVAAILATSLFAAAGNAAGASTPWEERSGLSRAAYTAAAVAVNVIPGVSALVAPVCLPGYILCKVTFAIGSVFAAGEQLFFSGGGDTEQTRAILYRGWEGDWYVTGRDVAGDTQPDPFPKPPPPTGSETPSSEGGFVPPPI